jgi:hypothetical protein
MHFNDRDEIIALTPMWKGERLPDGRPKVDEKYLKALRTLTLEEVWKPIFVKGYESQFEGRLQTLHTDGRKLIGRAVTATYCPYRPDLDAYTKELGKSEDLITYVKDRAGHEMRYAIDPTKIHNELGWLPETKFADGIKKTIKWYLENREWWERIISGEYKEYYDRMYSGR